MHKRRIGIMGAGRIAQGFDRPGDPNVLTVAHAVSRSSDFVLGGFFDLDATKAAAAERKWSAPHSPREREAWLQGGWDVIYIATPDNCHDQDFRDALSACPKAIFVEKPLSLNSAQGETLLQQAEEAGVAVLVNYQRRWHSKVQEMAARVREGDLGRLQAGTLTYSGGTSHNGVHLLDLLSLWLEGDLSARLSGREGMTTLLSLSTPAGNAPFSLTDLASEHYFVCEMHLFFSEGRIDLGGYPESLSASHREQDPLYEGFSVCPQEPSHEMEEEPLLEYSLTRLAEIINDPLQRTAQFEIEKRSTRFISHVLSQFLPASAGRS